MTMTIVPQMTVMMIIETIACLCLFQFLPSCCSTAYTAVRVIICENTLHCVFHITGGKYIERYDIDAKMNGFGVYIWANGDKYVS